MHEYLEEHFQVVDFILSIATELKLSALSKATACTLYHKAQIEQKKLKEKVHLDKDIVGPTCVYLASKLGEEALKIRDLVNISYRVYHPDWKPLEIGKTYWKLRDSVTTCELILLRLFSFHVLFETPQKYVLHYLKFLDDWATDLTEWRARGLSSICWSLMNDVCYLPLISYIPPDKLACAILFIGLKHTKLSVLEECEGKTWYKVFCPGVAMEDLRNIACDILQLYEWKKRGNATIRNGSTNRNDEPCPSK